MFLLMRFASFISGMKDRDPHDSGFGWLLKRLDTLSFCKFQRYRKLLSIVQIPFLQLNFVLQASAAILHHMERLLTNLKVFVLFGAGKQHNDARTTFDLRFV